MGGGLITSFLWTVSYRMFPNIVDPSKRRSVSVTQHKKSKFAPPTTTGLGLESSLALVVDRVALTVDFVGSFATNVGPAGEKELEEVESKLDGKLEVEKTGSS